MDSVIKSGHQGIPNGFYRVSIKALIRDDTGKKFAVVLEDNGWWELPGGGLDFGESPADCLQREIKEEMGLEVAEVGSRPSYYLIYKNMKDKWSVGLVFDVKVKDLKFIPSDEAREMKFISPDEAGTIRSWSTITQLAVQIKTQLMHDQDPLYEDAKRLVTKHGKSSLSFLQRHLFIDIDRTSRILDQLRSDGIIKT